MAEVTHPNQPLVDSSQSGADSLFAGVKINPVEKPTAAAEVNKTPGILAQMSAETKAIQGTPEEVTLRAQTETMEALLDLKKHYSGWGELFGLSLTLLNQGNLAGKEETVKTLINIWIEVKKIDLGQYFNVEALVSDAKVVYEFFNIRNKPENIQLIKNLLGNEQLKKKD